MSNDSCLCGAEEKIDLKRTPYEQVKEFHMVMNQPIGDPKDVTEAFLELRLKLNQEELREIEDEVLDESGYIKPYDQINHANLCAELADLIYVVSGFAVGMGYPLDEMFNAIHRANMSKLGDDGKPIYREDGKVP